MARSAVVLREETRFDYLFIREKNFHEMKKDVVMTIAKKVRKQG